MKKSKFIVLLLLFCLQPGFLTAQRAEAIRKDVLNPRLDKVLVVAHRGNWSIAPENSLAAIDSAIRMKVDIVEIDIRKTKDGQLVLMHDDTVDRTTNGTGKVKDKTLAEIKQLRLKDKDGRLTEHTVPTLEEALLAAKGQIMVNLDKAYSIFDDVYVILKKTDTADLVIMKGAQLIPCAGLAGRSLPSFRVMTIAPAEPREPKIAASAPRRRLKLDMSLV